MRRHARLFAIAAPLILVATAAQAAVTISSQSTQNMSCANGMCAPTAKNAVLNVNDLENLLASGDVEVTTTGSGVQADDISVKAALSWSSTHALSLLAHRSLKVAAPVSIAGQSGLTVVTEGKSGAFSFGKKGSITFANLSSQLAINGHAYTLVGDIKTLANDIANNPSGNFALAANYDASADGTYTSSPVAITLTGTFEGIGNTISNLTIDDPTNNQFVGLFAEVGKTGRLRHIGIVQASVSGAKGVTHHETEAIGALSGVNDGTINGSWATGAVAGGIHSIVGGLVGENDGTISSSSASATITGKRWTYSGGLVGRSTGTISASHSTGNLKGAHLYVGGGLVGEIFFGTVTLSYATGAAKGGISGGLVGISSGAVISYSFATGGLVTTAGNSGEVGGLVGLNEGTISNSYSTGSVSGESLGLVGGLIGDSEIDTSAISDCYSIGKVVANGAEYVGGFIGYDSSPGDIADSFWDTDTSGITNLSQGAGNIANDPGIAGLTTEQLQSGLPPGFDPAVWGQNANVNGGLPYLLANPPPK